MNQSVKSMFSQQFNKNQSLFIFQAYFFALMQLSIIIVSEYEFFGKIAKLASLAIFEVFMIFF